MIERVPSDGRSPTGEADAETAKAALASGSETTESSAGVEMQRGGQPTTGGGIIQRRQRRDAAGEERTPDSEGYVGLGVASIRAALASVSTEFTARCARSGSRMSDTDIDGYFRWRRRGILADPPDRP